jgi:DNA-binding CsgD family transcriptional regulator
LREKYGEVIGVSIFKYFRAADEEFVPVTPDYEIEALRQRVNELTGDEAQVYKWIREFYSERWIAETLLLGRRQARELIRRVCIKLGVRNVKELHRIYNRLERPKDAEVRTDEIDRYVDDRPGRIIPSQTAVKRDRGQH